MTLREIHERCKRRHFDHMTVNEQYGAPFDLCDACDMPWPCPDYQDAVAALAILDAAHHCYGEHAYRLVSDPPYADGLGPERVEVCPVCFGAYAASQLHRCRR